MLYKNDQKLELILVDSKQWWSTLAAIGVTALITGLGTYFAFKPSASNLNSGATAEIKNDVKIEENIERGADILSIFGMIILTTIALVKIVELVIYFIGRCKRSIKKKYEGRAVGMTTTTSATSTV